MHKCEVFSREHLARKTNLSHNLEDVFCRQHLSGDPGIREKDKPVRQIGLSIDNVDGKSTCILKTKGRLNNLCALFSSGCVPEGIIFIVFLIIL